MGGEDWRQGSRTGADGDVRLGHEGLSRRGEQGQYPAEAKSRPQHKVGKGGQVMRGFVAAIVVAGAICGGVTAAEPAKRTNVVVILADDLGYGDVLCYNPERGKIPTPHIDALASAGLRFT